MTVGIYDVFDILVYITVILSVICLILIYILLSDKNTNSSRLMRYICLSEAMFTFSEFIIIKNFKLLKVITFQAVNTILFNSYYNLKLV